MATVVDSARDADADVECAVDEFTQPTPRDYLHAFTINASVADTHIPAPSDAGDNGVNNSADAAAPIIDQSAFWLPSTPATMRFV